MSATIGATSEGVSTVNCDNLTDLKSIDEAFDALCKEEEEVNEDLELLLKKQTDLESQMISLHSVLPNLQLIHNDSQNLSSMISFTSTLAENVSSKVRQLDVAKSRVTECMQRVEDILDLKFCTDGVQTALQDEDYEVAAGHIHRFLSLDENVLRITEDADEGSSLDTSFKLLHEAQSKLKTIVHRQFDTAVHAGDVASVERFFKIFPLIGEHESGLTKFSKYLCSQLSDTADKNFKNALATKANDKRANVLYADTITMLFESIARVVEIHQPLVETYYGVGKLFIMMEHLQRECDRQARRIIENFKNKREFDRKFTQVEQSLSYHRSVAHEKLDPKYLDILLTEVTLLNTRAELYLRFVKRRVLTDLECEDDEDEQKKEKETKMNQFIYNCELSRLMQELIGQYILMEEYFMRESVVKAVNMDQSESGATTSSMVDDSFFIVKKCVRRALSSSSVDGVCAMLNHANSILEQDFRETLYAKLRQGFPSGFDITQAYNLMQSSFQQGKLQYSDPETQRNKMTFLVTLNNGEASCEYIKTLKQNLEDEVDKLYGSSQTSEQGRAKLQSCLSDLGAVSSRFKDVLEFGFSQLNSSTIKPQMKPWVETFLTTSHNITEEEYSNFEANDPWVQSFICNLDGLLASFKDSLTSSNYDTLVSHISHEITTQLEKTVFKMTFNRLGGLQFDKELRALVSYLTSVTTWTLRDKFARLTQMATILNLERVAEIMDYWGPNSGPLTWRLTPAEVRQVLTLRIDFRSEDIKRLKL